MVKVKILRTVITSTYGTLVSGDILNTSEAFAKHLVEECNAGDYLELAEKVEAKPEAKVEPIKKVKRGKV